MDGPAKPRRFQMVEALELRTKRDGSIFYRAAIFEEGGDRIKELYCKVDFKIRGLRGGGKPP